MAREWTDGRSGRAILTNGSGLVGICPPLTKVLYFVFSMHTNLTNLSKIKCAVVICAHFYYIFLYFLTLLFTTK
jgi:hypothetical protein